MVPFSARLPCFAVPKRPYFADSNYTGARDFTQQKGFEE